MLRSRFRNVNMNIFNVIVNADTHTQFASQIQTQKMKFVPRTIGIV